MTGRLLVLGGTGMLGSAMVTEASRLSADVVATTTDLSLVPGDGKTRFARFRVGEPLDGVLEGLAGGDYIVNCIGIIKHRIDDSSPADRALAIQVNSEFPMELSEFAAQQGFRVIQIATDCVFSGTRGQYDERDPHDPHDVYGKTKSLGEVPSESMMHIRASIVGRELKAHRSLVDWALSAERGSVVNGYTNHFWNGVTTSAFARVALGVILRDGWRPGIHHLVPGDMVSKFELLEIIYRAFRRSDIDLRPQDAETAIDRTLTTIDPQRNSTLWRDGGYPFVPSVRDLLASMNDSGPHE